MEGLVVPGKLHDGGEGPHIMEGLVLPGKLHDGPDTMAALVGTGRLEARPGVASAGRTTRTAQVHRTASINALGRT